MQRREFITLFGGTTITQVVLPQLARAQTSTRRPLLAVLGAVTREEFPASFMEGLRELGYVEGDNINVAYRFADGPHDRLPVLAEELIQLSPKVIVAAVTPAAVAVRRLTQTIPIVCPLLANPIELGLIASMSRPGGNVTGLMSRIDDLVGKQLELAAQLVPALVRVGLILNAVGDFTMDRQRLEIGAKRLGIKLVSAEVREPNDLDTAFQLLSNEHVQAVVVLAGAMLFQERKRVAALAATAWLPAVYGFRDHVDAGGLISYGVNYAENFRAAANYVVKILKGAKPADLPVEFPSKLELVINLKTAKALGLEIPPTLLARADAVIE
ncbi:ABC transporter substrate-binding protein [Bradyrhizobium sp. Ash2021]|uniref:ABC transporter substrate-binding protein n=1 Tax=Bradyrhizobium sp. Ash2021 TaxID=2954771 RepID=UPI0028165633|nr:ABC transporter substrate-binding protein [Bradyrhizobium sp. Ash2021]WMT75405.1 ABC transporter substrate-binding protein [Bradyrhizobium sp. Ash2021]